MKQRQRGVISGYVYLAGAIAILGLLSGMAYMAKSYIDGVKTDAHAAGRKAALLEVAQRDNAALVDLKNTITRLQAEKSAKEAAHAAEVAKVDKEGFDAKRKIEKERDALRARNAALAGQLRDPGRQADAGCGERGGGATATAVAPAGVGDGKGAAEGNRLSDEAGNFLRAEADAADQVVLDFNVVVVKLDACQKIAEDDRKTVNAEAPKAGAAP
jgi:hypothetical protein